MSKITQDEILNEEARAMVAAVARGLMGLDLDRREREAWAVVIHPRKAERIGLPFSSVFGVKVKTSNEVEQSDVILRRDVRL